MLLDASELQAHPEVEAAEGVVTEIATLADGYRVATPAEYESGAQDLRRVKAAQKRIEDLRTAFVKPLNDHVKRINEFFRAPAARLADAEGKIKRGLLAFQQEEDRRRRDEQRRLEEEARKERERLAKQAEKAAAAGKVEKAETLEARAAQVVAPVLQTETPKVAGVSTRSVWKFEIVDPELVPRVYLVPDEAKIRRVAQALKGDANIPGVRVYEEKQLAAGGW
jgi:hypothetical protein